MPIIKGRQPTLSRDKSASVVKLVCSASVVSPIRPTSHTLAKRVRQTTDGEDRSFSATTLLTVPAPRAASRDEVNHPEVYNGARHDYRYEYADYALCCDRPDQHHQS